MPDLSGREGARGDLPSIESLIAEHDPFVRTLVRAMLRDPDGVDDVTQDVWMTVVERKPVPGPGIRSWLAAVVRNHVSQRRRSERNRRALTHSYGRVVASRGDPVDDRLRQELLAAIDSLPEATRETLVMRYFEKISSDALGDEKGVAGATIRSRAHRGLAELRTLLQHRLRQRGLEWRSVVALAGLRSLREDDIPATPDRLEVPVERTPAISSGATKAVVGGGILAATTVLAITVWEPADSEPPRPERKRVIAAAPPNAAPTTPSGRVVPSLAPVAPDAHDNERTGTSVDAPTSGAAADRIALQVLSGVPPQPVPGARIAVISGDESTDLGTTDANGHLSAERVPEGRVALTISATGYERRTLPFYAAHGAKREQRIFIRPEAVLEGNIVHADEPISGEHHVRVHAFADVVGDGFPSAWLAPVDAHGRFTLQGLPAAVPLSLLVCDGPAPPVPVQWVGRERGAPLWRQRLRLTQGTNNVRVAIRQRNTAVEARPMRTVTGRLIDGAGRPVPRAYLRAGPGRVRSSRDGTFEITTLARARSVNIVPEPRAWLARQTVRIRADDLGDIRCDGGGRIDGEVHGALDLGGRGSILLTSADGTRVFCPFYPKGRRPAPFSVPSLAPGRWSVVVRTGNGQIGCTEAWTRRAVATTGIRIAVDLGLSLEVSIRTGSAGPYSITVTNGAGVRIEDAKIAVGERKWCFVPQGVIHLEVRDRLGHVVALDERLIATTTTPVVDLTLR